MFKKIKKWIWQSNPEGQNRPRFLALLAILLLLLVSSYFTSIFCGLAIVYIPKVMSLAVLLLLICSSSLVFLSFVIGGINKNLLLFGLYATVSITVFCICICVFSNVINIIPHKALLTLFPSETRFPMGDPKGIAVTKNGFIYLPLQAYSRIQKYDHMGNFVKGWFVGTGGGRFAIWIDGKTLNVITSRPYTHEIFDLDGIPISSRSISGHDEYISLFQKTHISSSAVTGDEIYMIRNRLWFPIVMKSAKGQEPVLIAKDPWYYFLFQSPLKSGLMALLGILVAVLLFYQRTKRISAG